VYKIPHGFGWFSGCVWLPEKADLNLQKIIADRSSDWNNDFAGDAIES
jgi:hypothetical protein